MGLVLSLGIKVEKGSRFGDIVIIERKTCINPKIMKIRDNSLMDEGARLYNSVPRKIRNYDGTYLEFKNLVDAWLGFIPDIPRVTNYEPQMRNGNGETEQLH